MSFFIGIFLFLLLKLTIYEWNSYPRGLDYIYIHSGNPIRTILELKIMRYSFSASPLTGVKNIILPPKVVIDTTKGVVIVSEPNLIGGKEVSLNISSTTISIDNGLLFSDVIVESAGGKKYVLEGFSRIDAERLLSTYSQAQGDMSNKKNVIDTSWSIRAAREENRLLQRKMRKSDEMLSIEERQIKSIKARMDELEQLEMELAKKRKELAELHKKK